MPTRSPAKRTSTRELPARSTRQRIVDAALDLFEATGFGATTIEAIADEAGVSRRTFFHYFRSKEDVLFPGHDQVLSDAEALLAGLDGDPVEDVRQALRLVFCSYVDDEATALRRYRLIRASPELRMRELAWVHRYQLIFARHLSRSTDGSPRRILIAEAVAAAFVATHNHVLREWLRRGGGGRPLDELDEALGFISESIATASRDGGRPTRVVAVFDADVPASEMLRHLRAALDEG